MTDVKLPSLDIYREITNVPEYCLPNLQIAYFRASPDLTPGQAKSIKFYKASHLHASLVIGGELQGFHREAGLPFGLDEAEALGDHLSKILPDEFDDAFSVDTYPPTIYEVGSRTKVLALGASERMVSERRIVLEAIHRHYNITDDVDDLWNDNDFMGTMKILRVGTSIGDKVCNGVAATLQRNPTIFPDELTYGPVNIESIDS